MVKFSLCTLSDEELVKKVDKLTDEMFQKQEVPTRNIPAEPNNDYDLLVGELLIRFSNQVKRATDYKQSIIEMIDEMMNEIKSPCKHTGCYNHITHACEGCGRIRGQITQEATMALTELKQKIEAL